jgi:serine/threonine protein kinase
MLTSNNVPKIIDFGSSRLIREDAGKTNDSTISIRWSSPESLADQVYSKSSDVWSFAVLLTEMVSKGEIPYKDLPTLQVALKVQKFLLCPINSLSTDTCSMLPKYFQEFLTNCGSFEPQERPSFYDLSRSLESDISETINTTDDQANEYKMTTN